MASIKEATENALKFAVETLGPERANGARLEEVESTKVDSDDAWVITLSMIDLTPGLQGALNAFSGRREYKTFLVLKRDGEVRSMKIRELADA